jgi:hypothetical protein
MGWEFEQQAWRGRHLSVVNPVAKKVGYKDPRRTTVSFLLTSFRSGA